MAGFGQSPEPKTAARGKRLLKLTAHALALPGICGNALAEADNQAASIAYRFSNYSEDDLSSKRVLTGSNQRYDIAIHQVQLDTPLGDRFRVSLDVSREIMGGASPQGVIQSEDQSSLLMSGATISEARTDVQLTGLMELDSGRIGAQIYRSKENDYLSRGGGLSFDYDLANKLTSVSSSISIFEDDIDPTDAELLGRIVHAEKSRKSAAVSVSQILNKYSLASVGVSVTRLTGYLSDPYKFDDLRPQLNTQWVLSAGYRRYFDAQDASLHVDLRYYRDQFGIRSETLDLSWYQSLGVVHQIVPSIRYYNQDKADFWRVSDFIAAPGESRSTDFRLSEFGAFSIGLKWTVNLNHWNFVVSGGRYWSSAGLALGEVENVAPALVDFSRLTAGMTYRF